MATLPRMKPDHFYDLVVEVAIIRPGPIVGKMVHPYLRRRNGEEEAGYLHPSLEPILKRTLGVPLFQEQLLRIAMTVAGFTGGEAEELRRAMGFKRSEKRMKAIETRLRSGMAERGITGEVADTIVRSISSFALYGFPESHAASFALIAYASAFLKCHHPAAFTCALLNNQPMGFYHPFTLVKDAQRHGVRFRPVDVTRSGRFCALEEGEVRLGLAYVRGLRAEAAERIEGARARAPFASLQDFVDRTGLRRDEQRSLAEVGALNALGGLTRRSALWQVEKAGRPRGPLFHVIPRDSEETGPEESALSFRGTPKRRVPRNPPSPTTADPSSPDTTEAPANEQAFPEAFPEGEWRGVGRGRSFAQVDPRFTRVGTRDDRPVYQVPVVRYSCMERAALRPAPMARMTVAAPVTMSPPAKTPFFEVRSVSGSATAM
jgi:hypothetical protein